jgi:ABC-type Fe3+-hydroxamate transport system substrate-binding protein
LPTLAPASSPTSAFTTVNSPFGTAGGGSTVKLVGPTVKRTAVYNGDLTQTQINALAGVNDDFWRWRVLGSSFALPNFTTNGSVTVDWGDGVVETLTTAVHTFTNGGGYHDIGLG